MQITYITDINDPRVAIFATLTEAQLRNRLNPDKALFIVESPKVIKVALQSGLTPVALLCEEKHIYGDAADIIRSYPNMPVYTGSREVLASLTGYTLTRGVLCAMRRPANPNIDEICKDAHRITIIYDVTDTTNIGAIFRSAAALGIDAVILSNSSCDPLNRRSVRVSMGSVFLVPWAFCKNPISKLKEIGFSTLAMALSENSLYIDNPTLQKLDKLAIVLGTEGNGLPESIINQCNYTVKIPMFHNVDSLNVAAASAVAFWELRHR